MHRREHDAARFGWPPIMGRLRAAEYSGVDPSTLDKARRAGELRPAGRRGGRGEHVYTREALDRWMCGLPADAEKAREDHRASPAPAWDDELEELAGGDG